jgi:hypothetical protein
MLDQLASAAVDHRDDFGLFVSDGDDFVSQSVSLIFPSASVKVAEFRVGS